MKNLEKVQNLKALLEHSKNWSCPMLVRMNTRKRSLDFLIDRIVDKVIESSDRKIKYLKLDSESSIEIKDELQILNNPVLVLFSNGEIKTIFSGMIAQYQIEQAIEGIDKTSKCKEAS